MLSELELAFHSEMVHLYKRTKEEVGYNATRFLSMITENPGAATAHALINAPTVSEGYTALWERKRLDLTIECVILEPRWRDLFSETERQIARKRLRDYGYEGDMGEARSS